jgi:tRNA(adenine34) deaminase
MVQRDEEFMREAIAEALKCGSVKKFGAVIVEPTSDGKGKIIIREHSTVLEDDDPTQHAELKAVRAAWHCYDSDTRLIRDTTLYATCEPCIMCAGAIGWARIGRIVCGMTRRDSPHNFKDSDPWHRSFESLVKDMKVLEYTTGVLAHECVHVLMPPPSSF